MERRIKLTMAAIALALLAAGLVRRWSKEGLGPLTPDAHDALASSHDVSGSFDESNAEQPLVAATPTWPHSQREFTSPAFPETANRAPNGPDDPADVGVMRASFLPNPQTSAPGAVPAGGAYRGPAEPSSPPPAAVAPPAPLAAPPQYPQTPYAAYPVETPRDRYVIQPNDSFWTISERVYGTAKYFQALYEHNRRLCPRPDRLPTGVIIETPPYQALERSYPDLFR